MEASRSATEKSTADTTLSRKLADFLVELSIALHKRSIYPVGHPYLRSSADRFADRVATLLESRESIVIGVARDRLVIESATTDPANALLRDLAHRLHRHQIASIGLTRGVSLGEIEDLLEALSADPDRAEGPLGRRLPAAGTWSHIQLGTTGYDRLRLQEAGPDSEGKAAEGRDFWLAFAQAALAGGPMGDPTDGAADEELIIRALDREGKNAAYDSVVVGYLSQVAEEQSGRAGVGEERLRRRVSRLLASLDPETLSRLLQTNADMSQRNQPLLGASETVALEAVAEILEAAAKSSHHTISHNFLGLLHKLAHQTRPGTAPAPPESDGALRRNVSRLIGGWELDDPNPGPYTAILQGMVREMPPIGPYDADTRCDPDVLVRMAVEVGGTGPAIAAAAEALAAGGRLALLAEILDAVPDGVTARAVWPQVATEARLRSELERYTPDHADIAILAAHLGVAAAEPLLDALERAVTRTTRAAILKHILSLGPGAAAAAAQRLPGASWYLQRNILVLIGQWQHWPDGFSPLPYATGGDVRVRREATKLLLASEEHRAAAIVDALRDGDDIIVSLALGAAVDPCPPDALPFVRSLVATPGRDAAIRAQAIRVLARAGGPEAVDTLVTLVRARRRWMREPLAPRSPAMLAAIAGLAQHWRDEPRAAAVLRDALRHRDRQVRLAAEAP